MKKILLSVFFALVLGVSAHAQEENVTENPADVKDDKSMSIDELKNQRAALLAMAKSEEFLAKLAKADNLKVPNSVGVSGVDALTNVVSSLLTQLRENRNMIPQLYASVTGQTIDGGAATGIQPVTSEQMLAFSKMFVQMGTTLVKSSKDLISLPGEIKSAGPMKILKSVKSIAYIKNAIGALKQELTYNSKMVKNLIETHKLDVAANTH